MKKHLAWVKKYFNKSGGARLLVRAQASYYVTGEFHSGDYPAPAAR